MQRVFCLLFDGAVYEKKEQRFDCNATVVSCAERMGEGRDLSGGTHSAPQFL
jgi:hypothetical protein